MYTMNPQLRRIVEPLLTKHESKRRRPYLDTDNPPNITIGIGRNLSDKGLSESEILYLFNNDLREAEETARFLLTDTIFDALSLNRQAVILDMAFNLGRLRLSSFHNTLQAAKEGRYNDAAAGMRASLWAKQVGERAVTLANMMQTG